MLLHRSTYVINSHISSGHRGDNRSTSAHPHDPERGGQPALFRVTATNPSGLHQASFWSRHPALLPWPGFLPKAEREKQKGSVCRYGFP